MRRRRVRPLPRARFVLASLAIHGGLVLLVGRVPRTSPPPALPPPTAPLPITLIRVTRSSVARPVSPSAEHRGAPPASAATHRPLRSYASRAVTAPVERAPERAPPSDAESPPARHDEGERATPPAGGAIDLYSAEALGRALARGDQGGPPRRGAPGGDGSARDPVADREEAAARLHAWSNDLVGHERVASGSVSPRWRDVERQLGQSFHPSLALVKKHDVARTFTDQVIRAWMAGPPPSAPWAPSIDPSAPTPGLPERGPFRTGPLDQQAAVQSEWAKPAEWLRTEVEVVVDELGRLLSTRVVVSSGRRRYDAAAQEAVARAMTALGAPEEHRPVVARWSVEAALQVMPPSAIGFGFDESGQLNPGATGIRRYIDGVYPLQQRVLSKVRLLSVAARR